MGDRETAAAGVKPSRAGGRFRRLELYRAVDPPTQVDDVATW